MAVQCADGSGTPTVPDDPPWVVIRSGSGVVQRASAPVLDRYLVTALFALPLRLSSSYSPGRYTATYFYKAGSYYGIEVDYFEVAAGGDAEGEVLSQYFLSLPQTEYLVQQSGAGNTLLRRGPALP
jgi:hypothetical protein